MRRQESTPRLRNGGDAPDLWIVTNQRSPKHGVVVLDLLARARRVWMFVAYVRNGIDELETALRAACARKAEIELYCGLSQHISDPEALWRLLRICDEAEARNGARTAKLYLCEGGQTFHPKMYCFFSKSDLTLVVGSANLTAGGLKNNIEASSIQTFPVDSEAARDVKAFRRIVLKMAEGEANGPRISRYRQEYAIYHRERDKADRQAKSDIRDLKIESYLKRYHNEGKDKSFRDRKIKYRKAKGLLRKLAGAAHLTKPEFLQIYSELVGGGREPKRWTSSGIWRKKGEVTRHYRDVASLVGWIRDNRARTPKEVFSGGKQRIKKIGGFGVNLLTEVMHTFGANKFAILNKNPLISLGGFGYKGFPRTSSFKPDQYARFNSIMADFARKWDLESIAQTDHFLSYVYWQEKRKKRKKNFGR